MNHVKLWEGKGELVVASPITFCEMLAVSTFQGRSTVIHVPRGVVVRELNANEALELKDLDKVPPPEM